MFKFIAVCFFAVLAVAAGKPGILAPLAYNSPLVYSAATPLAYSSPAAAVVGHTSYIAPYATSYNAHNVAHSAAFPAAYTNYAIAPAFSAPVATPFAAPLLLKK